MFEGKAELSLFFLQKGSGPTPTLYYPGKAYQDKHSSLLIMYVKSVIMFDQVC
jgi:hypothetical protein